MQFLESYFEHTAGRLPSAIAVDDDGATVSYGELDARANRIAHFLIAEGVVPNDRVCIFTGKNANAYAALLGILKAGACWVPLDPNLPLDRLGHLVRTIDPKFILTQPDILNEAKNIRTVGPHAVPLLILRGESGIGRESIYAESGLSVLSDERPSVERRSPNDLAYIIFTSGSSGTPKGVMVLHRNITQFLDLCPQFFKIEEGSRFAHHSDLTFDPSLFDLFYGWACAGTIVPFKKASHRINPLLFVREARINVWFSVPSAITNLVESGGLADEAVGNIKHLLLTGEPIPAPVVRAWYDAWPDATIYNVYGTTESAIISHWYVIPQDISSDRPVPVGRPLPGFNIRLMDGDRLVAAGEIGECYSYSSQISAGYWANESETDARFVRDPLDARLPQIWYRAGDLLRMNDEGLYEYFGRSDSQVKVRGHRIELGEIEFALKRHEVVAEAAVIAWKPEGAPQEARLVAFVAAREPITSDILRNYLADSLPRYMLPSRIVISALPLLKNLNGKIDRIALASQINFESMAD